MTNLKILRRKDVKMKKDLTPTELRYYKGCDCNSTFSNLYTYILSNNVPAIVGSVAKLLNFSYFGKYQNIFRVMSMNKNQTLGEKYFRAILLTPHIDDMSKIYLTTIFNYISNASEVVLPIIYLKDQNNRELFGFNMPSLFAKDAIRNRDIDFFKRNYDLPGRRELLTEHGLLREVRDTDNNKFIQDYLRNAPNIGVYSLRGLFQKASQEFDHDFILYYIKRNTKYFDVFRKEFFTEEEYLDMLTVSGSLIKHIPEKNVTQKMLHLALTKAPSTLSSAATKKKVAPATKLKLMMENKETIKHFKKGYKDAAKKTK